MSEQVFTNCTVGGAISVYVSGKYAYVASFNDDSFRIVDIAGRLEPAPAD